MTQQFARRWPRATALIVMAIAVIRPVFADDWPPQTVDGSRPVPATPTPPANPDGVFSEGDARIRPASLQQGAQPTPLQPAPQPFFPTAPSPAAARDLRANVFGTRDASLSLLSQARRSHADGLSAGYVLGSESQFRATTDTGNLLRKSANMPGVASQSRSPIVTDPRIRGSRIGQLVASGSYWFPSRQDLDTILSKIDSRIISDLIVVKGPYAARYGPGFNFIDVELLPSPRFADGYETHGSTSMDYKSNGQQFYGRQSVWGGNDRFGFRVSYGHRGGNDYEDAIGRNYISSYKSRDVDVALGYDLSPDSRIEFSYLRLDQTDVELASQTLDLDLLVTDGYKVKYTLAKQDWFDNLSLDGWYNQTHTRGNLNSAGKQAQVPILAANNARSVANSRNSSTGFRLALDWGAVGDTQTTVGVDLRYLTQEINQFSTASFFPPANFFGNNASPEVNGPLPSARSVNPGIFLEVKQPVRDRLVLNGGGRVDFVESNANRTAPEVEGSSGFNGALYNPNGQPIQVAPGVFVPFPTADLTDLLGGRFDRTYGLAMAYLTAKYELNDNWTGRVGSSFAMRAPTMTELYSFNVQATVLPQTTLSLLNGNPNLNAEKRYQIDTGLSANYGPFRASADGYFAWIQDFITYDLIITDFIFYNYVNTDLATLAGVELAAEYDVNQSVTLFGTMNYVEGTDRTRNTNGISAAVFGRPNADPRSQVATRKEPLPVIAPLETRLGVRLHEPGPKARWGVELSARVVDDQDRFAQSLGEQFTPGFTTFDLRVFWKPTPSLTIVAGIENFTNKLYQEHFDPHSRQIQTPPFLVGSPFVSAGTGSVFRQGVNAYVGTEVVY